MIKIVADTIDELTTINNVVISGVLNISCAYSKKNPPPVSNIEVEYSLSSGDTLLYNEYNRIVGVKSKND